MEHAPIPHVVVTTDIVIFTIREQQLMCLLVEKANEPYNGQWALPGGFVKEHEALDAAARRVLMQETGLSGVYLEQLYTFGDPQRDPRERIISVGYYALIPTDQIKLRAALDAQALDWFSLSDLPQLVFDHLDIIKMAHQRLAAKLDYSTIAFQFMPSEFTLSELQHVYEIIFQEKLDKRNFRKRILAMDQIEESGGEKRVGAHRPAKLYRVKEPRIVEIIK